MNKGTILIVQNDPQGLKVLKEYFDKAGHYVLIANDAAHAWAAARQEMPQAIILDLDTPGLDTAALIQEVRATPRTRHIHVTLLTPRGEREDKLAALDAGADEFLLKPIDVEELGLRVRNALRRAAFDNLMNPITGLPGPRLIEEQLRSLLRRQDNWAVIRISFHGFRLFGDAYGFLAGEEVLRFAARLFSQTVDRLGTRDDFLGHNGGDNFIIVSTSDHAQAIAAELATRFEDNVKAHYSFREREQGYMLFVDADGNEQRTPLMTLATFIIASTDGPFSDIRELTQALGA